MLIDNVEALKKWLMDYLPPLCDADPEVLARYCLALVRKNQPNSELRKSMVEQLDVFLKTSTESFVDKFLEVAKSKSYLPQDKDPEAATSSIEKPVDDKSGNSPDSTTANIASNIASIPSPTRTQPPLPPLPPLPPPLSTIPVPHPPPENTPPYPPSKKDELQVVTSSIKPSKSSSDRDRDDRRPRRHSRSRSREKSRSRSRDRNRRSRSRGRSNRNKYDDRRRIKRYRSRSRSPRWSRSPPSRRSRDRRSRSHSPLIRSQGRLRTRSISPHGHVSPNSKNSPLKDKEKSPSPNGTQEKAVVHTITSVPSKDSYSSTSSQRCRDYDVQGFCMRGDQCPFDHGTDPFVLEGGLEFSIPMTSGAPPISVPPTFPPRGSLVQDIPGRPFLRPPPPLRPSQFEEYTPNNPSLWSNGVMPPFFRGRHLQGPPPRFTGPPPPLPNLEREPRMNVPVQVEGLNNHNKNIRSSLAQRLGPATNNTTSVAKLPVRKKFGNYETNCTLELRKVPFNSNSISHLNKHFAKFGSVVNIQVLHDADPEAALVTFSNHSQARAAYLSTEAVLNNRFIKLFWHNSQNSDASFKSSNSFVPTATNDRFNPRNSNKSLNNKIKNNKTDKVLLSEGSLTKIVYNVSTAQTDIPPAAKKRRLLSTEELIEASETSQSKQQLTPVEIKKKEIEIIQKQQELLKAEVAAKNKAEKQKAYAIKLKTEVDSRTRQLLKEQMQHVKLLLNKLEKNKATMKIEEIKNMMSTIKSLQTAVETTKTQLLSNITPPTAPSHPLPIRSKSQVDKEILDSELEMYTLQSEGQDITHVRSRLTQLKTQSMHMRGGKFYRSYVGTGAATCATVPSVVLKSTGFRGRPFRGGRGRGHGGSAVDRRTTSINASGFEREDKDQVLAHFAGLGQLTNYSWDDLTPAISVQFETRNDAEKAMSKGRTLEDRLLTLTWVPNFKSVTSQTQVKKSTPSANSTFDVHEEITEEIIEEETEESFIYEDEVDEEDEEGGRSWRH